MRLMLGHLWANGDCLYASTIARQIKEDYPGSHLTWVISSQCAALARNNPYVDKVTVIEARGRDQQEAAWYSLSSDFVRERGSEHLFDRVWLSQVWPDNFRRFDGTVRPSIFRGYDRPITVPVDPIIELEDEEIENAARFAKKHALDRFEHCFLFECSSASGQSHVTPQYAIDVARKVRAEIPQACFILSTGEDFSVDDDAIFSGKSLSIRENAAITHHCTAFVGCGSGLTVVATSTASKELPNFQALRKDTSIFASFFYDFEHFGKDSSRFVETADLDAAELAAVLVDYCRDGFEDARAAHHRPVEITFGNYCGILEGYVVDRGFILDAAESLTLTAERFGLHPDLKKFAWKKVAPFLSIDPRAELPAGKRQRDMFRSKFDL